jgi:hypothetical protein
MTRRLTEKQRTFWWLIAWGVVLLICFAAMLQIAYGQPPPPPVAPLILPQTQPVTLAWDPSPDASVGGYIVHYGDASGFYTMTTNVGTATTGTVQGLIPLTTNFFAVTAVGTNQLESDFSNEIMYVVPALEPAKPTALGLSQVIVVRMKLKGADSVGLPWTVIADIPVIVDSDKPSGVFSVELDITTVEGVNW